MYKFTFMKTSILLTVFSALFFLTNATGQTWQWARSAHSRGQEGFLAETDRSNHVFIAGSTFSDSLCIGHDTVLIPDPLHHSYPFIAKFDNYGNEIWMKAGINSFSYTIDITVDKNGNSYLFGGLTTDSIIFDGHVVHDTLGPLKSAYFLVKYDPSGNVLWVRQGGPVYVSMPWACPRGIVADTLGNVYISGTFSDSITHIGPVMLTNRHYASGFPRYDVFVAKYDPSGTVLWAKDFGGQKSEDVADIDINSSNELVISGNYSSDTLWFDSLYIKYTSTVSGANTYVAKIDQNGNAIWLKKVSAANAGIQGVKVDHDENIYLGGGTYLTSYSAGGTTVACPNGCASLIKYDSAGNFLFLKTMGSVTSSAIGGNQSFGLTVDACNNVWLSGLVSKNIIFDSATIGYVSVTTDTDDAMFFAGFDPAGHLIAHDILLTGGDDNSSLAADRYGNIYLCSDNWLKSTPFVLGPDTLLDGYENIYVAKYHVGDSCVITGEPGPDPLYTGSTSSAPPVVNLYPDPAGNECSISIANMPCTGGSVSLFDITGRLLHTYPLTGATTTLSLTSVPAGIYHFKIDVNSSTSFYKKLVVIK